MRKVKDLGKKIIGYSLKGKPQYKSYGIFACDSCDTEIELTLSRGKTQKYCQKCKSKTHGLANTRQYYIWQAMKARCSNPNNSKYHIYGGKGIKVCDKWLTFEGFWEDNKDNYSDDLTIDRIDSSKGYNPENVRWVSLSRNSSETIKRRPVNQLSRSPYSPKEFIFFKRWESAKAAADELSLNANHITVVCQGKRKTHGGFSWEYSNQVH